MPKTYGHPYTSERDKASRGLHATCGTGVQVAGCTLMWMAVGCRKHELLTLRKVGSVTCHGEAIPTNDKL